MRSRRLRQNHFAVDVEALPRRVVHMSMGRAGAWRAQDPLLTGDWVDVRTLARHWIRTFRNHSLLPSQRISMQPHPRSQFVERSSTSSIELRRSRVNLAARAAPPSVRSAHLRCDRQRTTEIQQDAAVNATIAMNAPVDHPGLPLDSASVIATTSTHARSRYPTRSRP